MIKIFEYIGYSCTSLKISTKRRIFGQLDTLTEFMFYVLMHENDGKICIRMVELYT